MEGMGEEELYFPLLKSVKRKKAQFRANVSTHFVADCSSRVEKIFHSFAALTREIFFQHSKRIFVSPSGHVISSI